MTIVKFKHNKTIKINKFAPETQYNGKVKVFTHLYNTNKMLVTTSTRPLLQSPLVATTYRPIFRRTTTQIRMSTTSPSSLVEHVVLFNVKPTAETTQLSTMVNGLNTLAKLPMVIHLATTKLHRNRSSSLPFTHILHSRYRTQEDLADYSAHPDHLSVVRANVLPICDDIMAVDWVAKDVDPSSEVIKPGAAVRVQLIKLKEGKGKEEVFEVIHQAKEKIGGVEQMTVGENFSPARAKGFEICSVRVFGAVEEMDALDTDEEIAKEVEKEKEKVRESIESLVVVDYVVPELKS